MEPDADVTLMAAGKRREIEQYLERRRREKRIEQYEAERAELEKSAQDNFLYQQPGIMRGIDGALNTTVAKRFYGTVAGGVRDGVVMANQKIADSVGWWAENQNRSWFQLMYGKEAGSQVAEKTGQAISDRVNVASDLPEVPYQTEVTETDASGQEFTRPSYTESLPRGMIQFGTVYAPALGFMRLRGAGPFTGDIAAGALADMLAFENKTGTLSDLARAHGFDNELTQYLSGELSDNEFDASLKAALEGAGLGAGFGAISLGYQGLKKAGWRGRAAASTAAIPLVSDAEDSE